jgi:hypothetical protein
MFSSVRRGYAKGFTLEAARPKRLRSSTLSRVPRMQGLPPKIAGLLDTQGLRLNPQAELDTNQPAKGARGFGPDACWNGTTAAQSLRIPGATRTPARHDAPKASGPERDRLGGCEPLAPGTRYRFRVTSTIASQEQARRREQCGDEEVDLASAGPPPLHEVYSENAGRRRPGRDGTAVVPTTSPPPE